MRQRLRRLLGIEDQQETITGLIREIEELREELSETQSYAGAGHSRHDSLRREVEELGILARSTQEALGGAYWTTASGIKRPIALLSDTHLAALADKGWAKGSILGAVRIEQQRREEDDDWADSQGPGSLRNRVQRLEENTPVAPRRGPLNFEVTEPGDEQVLISALFRALLSRER